MSTSMNGRKPLLSIQPFHRVWMIVLIVMPLGPTIAAEFAPEVAGERLVSVYCADCHATGRSGDSPLASAPRFRELHKRYDVEALSEALVEGIVTAHDEMPEFEFDPDQAAAIVSYLKSLE